MIDTTLLNRLTVLAEKERKLKEYKRRIRLKGKVIAKGVTKKKNLTLTVEKDHESLKFTILRSHKDTFLLAEHLKVGKSISIEGIPKFRMIICTRLKTIDKGIDVNKQVKLTEFS